jgi:allophanate hydrolase subunit 1
LQELIVHTQQESLSPNEAIETAKQVIEKVTQLITKEEETKAIPIEFDDQIFIPSELSKHLYID